MTLLIKVVTFRDIRCKEVVTYSEKFVTYGEKDRDIRYNFVTYRNKSSDRRFMTAVLLTFVSNTTCNPSSTASLC